MKSSFTTEALFNRTKTIGNVTLVRKVPDDSEKFDYEIHGDIKGDDFLETDADDLPEGSEVMIYSLNPISQSSKEAGLYETLGHEKKNLFHQDQTGVRGWLQNRLDMPDYKGWVKENGLYGVHGPMNKFLTLPEIEAILGHSNFQKHPEAFKKIEDTDKDKLSTMIVNDDVEGFVAYYVRLENSLVNVSRDIQFYFTRTLLSDNKTTPAKRLIYRFLLSRVPKIFDRISLVNGHWMNTQDYDPDITSVVPINVAIQNSDEWLCQFLLTNGAFLTEMYNEPIIRDLLQAKSREFVKMLIDAVYTKRGDKLTPEEKGALQAAGYGDLI